MNEYDPIVIVGMARTPMGGFQGVLREVTAPVLGSFAIRAALERSGVTAKDIDEVLMGCVLPAGMGQAPARQASLGAGIPNSTGCTTVNKMCGSGMKSTMMAHDALRAETNENHGCRWNGKYDKCSLYSSEGTYRTKTWTWRNE